MAQYFVIHAENPQSRLIQQAAQLLKQGGVLACPTDSSYALVCLMEFKDAQTRIRRLRGVDDEHPFTLICRDLAEIGTYAKVNNSQFRLLKAMTPGAYTFLLEASREVPRRLQHPKRSTIGLRVPKHVVTQALLEALDSPLLSMTLQLPGDEAPMSVGWEIREALEHQIDAVIDSDIVHVGATTVVDLTQDPPELVRAGVAPWP
ncbi:MULTISPECIES: L-threonylcarbamoyladenylate synthase [unclassified Methylophilus]|uniref:L-threonylcarbamoyladenylate synthase n=1 Tax=unclassified Methylophilus TaxID=2630143 RepID=UPI00188F304F|nr:MULTISPECIES: L-threonylcarbamoyladenylate synthase [unclassified Methylophilus]MBF4987288.1 threonylcarbamoyl-AMP synthase [Methylophilus sp. 14]MBF4990335.1 threonylcarbamoyl-AMP synthase [Methylophilus sp. QUAN]